MCDKTERPLSKLRPIAAVEEKVKLKQIAKKLTRFACMLCMWSLHACTIEMYIGNRSLNTRMNVKLKMMHIWCGVP